MDDYGPYMDASAPYAVRTVGGGLLVPRRVIIGFRPGKVHSDGHFSSGEGVIIHANSAHITIGVQLVRIQPDGDLEIVTDGSMTPVTTCSSDADETLAPRGISVGFSVGPTTVARFGKEGVGKLDLTNQAHYDMLAGPYSNLWAQWETAAERV